MNNSTYKPPKHLFRMTRLLKSIDPSLLLFISAVAAIFLANSPWQMDYFSFLRSKVHVMVGSHNLFSHHGETMTLQQFVNDVLMAVFFFIIGLEIKMELLVGQLSSVKRAMLPVVAAVGGMIIPVLTFYAFVHDPVAMRGAAIPMATDIAFALAVLAVLGKRVPNSLKIFLMSLAVVDDIGGIIIIAIFYSGKIFFIPFLIGLLLLGLTYWLGRKGMNKAYMYYFIGFFVWASFLESGIHTTISGVLFAFVIPSHCTVKLKTIVEDMSVFAKDFNTSYEQSNSLAEKVSHFQLLELKAFERRLERTVSPVQFIQHDLHPLVNYLILPLFAFVNSGVTFGGVTVGNLMGLPLAIFLGLFFGKTLGIFLFTYFPNRFHWLSFPTGMTNKNLLGISVFGGIGFTVSLFIASLSYSTATVEGQMLLNQAKIRVFSGTIVSALVGLFILNKILKKENVKKAV